MFLIAIITLCTQLNINMTLIKLPRLNDSISELTADFVRRRFLKRICCESTNRAERLVLEDDF